jgi:hypothetical protein
MPSANLSDPNYTHNLSSSPLTTTRYPSIELDKPSSSYRHQL